MGALTRAKTIAKNYSKTIWPVEAGERSKFLPLFLIKLFVSFNYTILAAVKDTVVVAHVGGGAETIPAIKGSLVIVFAFLAMLAYSKLSNVLSRDGLFYTVLSFFLVLFFVYGFVLFPYQEYFTLDSLSSLVSFYLGPSNYHWVYIVKYWMNALFFVAAELWGGVVIALLFWGFVNQISTMYEAAKFYALYTLGGHLGSFFGGGITMYISGVDGYNYSTMMRILTMVVVLVGIMILSLYSVITSRNDVKQAALNASGKEKKPKLNLAQSLKYICTSPHLGWIALLLIGYSLSVNLVEVTWKAIIKIYYPSAKDYQYFMGAYQMVLGVTSVIVALFVSGPVLRKKGWLFSARLTPLVMGCTSILFLGFYFFIDSYKSNLPLSILVGASPIFILVIIGAIHNLSCKVMKYCVFDPTKEMAYIPLDLEGKVKGKAAVDLVAARFGKSGSSWIQIGLLSFVGSGSIFNIVPYLVPCLAVALVLWFLATKRLDISMQNKSSDDNDSDNSIPKEANVSIGDRGALAT